MNDLSHYVPFFLFFNIYYIILYKKRGIIKKGRNKHKKRTILYYKISNKLERKGKK